MMKKSARSYQDVLFLMLCAILPVSSFFASNRLEPNIQYNRIVIYSGVLIASLLLVFYLIKRFFPKVKSQPLSYALGLTFIGLFHLFMVNNVLQNYFEASYSFRYFWVGAPIGLAGLGLLIYKLFQKFSDSLKGFFIISLSSLVAINAYQVISTPSLMVEKTTSIQKASLLDKRPNVYYIVPDMMMGPEAFKAFFNKEHHLAQYLKQSGFHLNAPAYSNAPFTIYSLAHVFNMDYLVDVNEVIEPEKAHKITRIFQGDNVVFSTFRELGYTISHVTDGYVSHCMGFEDECLGKGSSITRQDIMFFDRTKLISLLNSVVYKMKWDRPLALSYPKARELDDIMPTLNIQSDSGRFMFIHLALPHHPYRFKSDCSKYNGDVLFQGTDKMNVYVEQFQCSEKKLETLVSHIIEKDPNSLIIVQSDHGPLAHKQGFKMNTELSDEDLLENFNILSAYRAPEQCQAFLPEESLSPVNSFRFVFGCLKNEKPTYLPHQSLVVYPLNFPAGKLPALAYQPQGASRG